MKLLSPASKFNSRKEWEQYIWKIFVDELVHAISAQEVEQLLNRFMTAHEKEYVIKRVAGISFLAQGKSYREIVEILWLSPRTISAIKKSIFHKTGYISSYTRRKNEGEKKETTAKRKKERLYFKTSDFGSGYQGRRVILPHGQLVYPRRRHR